MKYNISKSTPPAMPNLGRGMECVQLLLSQTSKDMHQALVPMLFPVLGAHISGAEFMYPDRTWKEMCGMMGNPVAESGAGKGQLPGLVEALCRTQVLQERIPQRHLRTHGIVHSPLQYPARVPPGRKAHLVA